VSSLVRPLNPYQITWRYIECLFKSVHIALFPKWEDRTATLIAHSRTNDTYEPASIPESTRLDSY
jgi:hypothetical protein